MDQVVLFGDSLTQFSSDQSTGFSFKAAVEAAYIRKLDVVNRGFSGYNTNDALRILPHIIQKPSCGRIRLLVVFFGANDARLPGAPPVDQFVPLDQYARNLRLILDHQSLAEHKSSVILVTPPLIDEQLCEDCDRTKGNPVSKRDAFHTAKYAQAVRDLGKERSIPVLDLWSVFLKYTGYSGDWNGRQPLPGSRDAPVSHKLRELLSDGLHFSGKAYKILYNELLNVIASEIPTIMADNLPLYLPEWNNEERWKNFDGPCKSQSG